MKLTKKERENLETTRKVTECMKQLGVPAHLRGYHFLRESIIMTMQDFEAAIRITKLLYPAVANVYQTTDQKVERAIRNAVEVAWSRGSMELQKNIFGYNSSEAGRPTNTEFIASIANYINLKE